MPEIKIKEVDSTKAIVGTYSNFTVLIPGMVGDGTKEGFVDDIYEFTNAADFEKIVGCSKTEISSTTAEYAIPETTIASKSAPTLLTQEQFNALTEDDKSILYWVSGTGGVKGKLVDASGNIYTKWTSEKTWSATIKFALIKEENVGRDAGNTFRHFGNELAYRLLVLGYRVIYKKFSSLNELALTSFWKPLEDKAYDFRYILTGYGTVWNGTSQDSVNTQIQTLAKDRGDCIALCDISYDTYNSKLTISEAITAIGTAAVGGNKYSMWIAPYVTYDKAFAWKPYYDTEIDITLPGSFHYLACAISAFQNYNEWYAVAGYTRGIGSYSVKSTKFNFGDSAVNILEPRIKSTNVAQAVNLIIKTRNNGYVLWGNRTAEPLLITDLKASHFLNIRQLCCTIKKQVYVTCKQYSFDPNSDILWVNFCNAIKPTLEKMKADQGIKGYRFVKETNVSKGLLKAIIRIIPIEAVEDFDITITLEDSFDGAIEVSSSEE